MQMSLGRLSLSRSWGSMKKRAVAAVAIGLALALSSACLPPKAPTPAGKTTVPARSKSPAPKPKPTAPAPVDQPTAPNVDTTFTGAPPLTSVYDFPSGPWTPAETMTPLTDGVNVYSVQRRYSNTTLVYASRLSDGTPVWGPIAFTNFATPSLSGGRLFLLLAGAGGPTSLVALDTRNGKTLWKVAQPFGGDVLSEEVAPIVYGGNLYLGALIYDPVSGKLLGRLPTPAGHHVRGVVFSDDAMYASESGTAWKVDLASKALHWVHTEPAHPVGSFSSLDAPVLHDGQLYVWINSNRLSPNAAVLDAATGQLIKTEPEMPIGFSGSLTIVERQAADTTRNILGLDGAGNVVWSYAEGVVPANPSGSVFWPNELTATSPVVGNVMYVTIDCDDGHPVHFLALNVANGAVLWSGTTLLWSQVNALPDNSAGITLVGKYVLVPTDLTEVFKAR